MKNEYRITRHEFDGEFIVFFHNERIFVKNPNTDLYEFKGYEEKVWFKARFHDWSDVQLSSNAIIYSGYPCSCREGEVMKYFRSLGDKCVCLEHKELPNYDESPYGKSVQFGTYIIERWDLSKLVG